MKSFTAIWLILLINFPSFPQFDKPVKFPHQSSEIDPGYLIDYNYMDINKITMLFTNAGSLGRSETASAGNFENSPFLYSGGFFLSGYNSDTLWANGVESSSGVEDYLPGKVGSDPDDFKNKIYIVKSSDPPFGISWQEYSQAVDKGADFYDGNSNGIYDPVDINSNGQWDLSEDRPDALGDMTAWCVYNDARPASERWYNQDPLGIEIKQTLFAYSEKTSPNLAHTVFVRYRIENTGTVSEKLDSVIFSFATDTDLGDANDDLSGTDTTLSSFFGYNSGSDWFEGDNPPPAFFGTLLQLPPVYLPGETFSDNNSNNIYDEGVDTPLDTAVLNYGPLLGSKNLPGSKNQVINSYTPLRGGDPNWDNASNKYEVRNYALGRNWLGEITNPCTFPYGEVRNILCSIVNPLFHFSGDPVTDIGWINTISSDLYTIFSSAYFDLEAGKPVDIILSYSVDRGYDAVNSITQTRKVVKDVIDFYKSNFTDIPVSIKDETNLLNSFKLFQNYPNPFNPASKIKWHSPQSGRNTIKIYDILGNLISVLIDEVIPTGSYEADFNAANLASGIYFYQFNVNEFSSTKKMIVLK